MGEYVDIAGISVPVQQKKAGWLPDTKLVLTATTKRNLQKIIPPLLYGQNLLLVGDAGVGKNALLYYINSLRSCTTIRYSMNEDTLADDLIGSYRMDPILGNFIWLDGPLSRALRQGACFIADEMNLCNPSVLKRFHSVFTDSSLELLEGDASTICAQPGFSFVATQNPSEYFIGRKNLPREIRKYFSTIYIDSYSNKEQIEILSGLYPDLTESQLLALVNINQEVETLLSQSLIGSTDMEAYHFNLRNLKRLASRLVAQVKLTNNHSKANKENDLFWEENLNDIYLAPFRQKKDKVAISKKLTMVLAKQVSYQANFQEFLGEANQSESEDSLSGTALVHADSKNKQIQIGRISLDFIGDKPELFRGAVADACSILPPLKQNAKILETIAAAIAQKENLLLECAADVEAEDYLCFFSSLLGRPLRVITFSRGMHTNDIIGGIKPIVNHEANGNIKSTQSVKWMDGPLSTALRKEEFILFRGLEAAGPELIEKLNMLLDDAKALLLATESGEEEPLVISKNTRIFAIKYFRTRRNTASISRAFRNRFSSLVIPPIDHRSSLIELIGHFLNIDQQDNKPLLEAMADFHAAIRKQAIEQEIGASNSIPYEFGLTNLKRWCHFILLSLKEEFSSFIFTKSNQDSASQDQQRIIEAIRSAAEIAYSNEIMDPLERKKVLKIFDSLFEGKSLSSVLDSFINHTKDISTKKKIKNSGYKSHIWWDQKKHWRKINTNRFKAKLRGQSLKKGIEINTPETGGNIKEGPDAWYGSDTLGNKGQGEPQGGGGAWGYRTEELYNDFLRKRRILWSYDIGITLEEFKQAFAAELQKFHIRFDKLLEPKSRLNRFYSQQGSRVDMRRYLAYLSGQGEDRVFDNSVTVLEKNQLEGVELVFALNKGRRIFNFEYSFATLAALMGAVLLLQEYSLPYALASYSDLKNNKQDIDLIWHKRIEDEWNASKENDIFSGLTEQWHGDTVREYLVLDELAGGFSTSGPRTRILVIFSDFRGHRGKISLEEELGGVELRAFIQNIKSLRQKGILSLGVGLGPRALEEYIFEEKLDIGGENFMSLPSLLIMKITQMIQKYHEV